MAVIGGAFALALALAVGLRAYLVPRLGVSPYVWFPAAPPDAPPLARSRQAIAMLPALVAAYLVSAGLYAGAVRVAGRVADDQALGAVVEVMSDGAAAEAGVESGDRIVAVEGETTTSFSELAQQVGGRPDKSTTITVERDGARREVEVTPRARGDRGVIGVRAVVKRVEVSLASAISEGLGAPFRTRAKMLSGATWVVVDTSSRAQAGPVAIVREASSSSPGTQTALSLRIGAYFIQTYGLGVMLVVAFLTRPRRRGVVGRDRS